MELFDLSGRVAVVTGGNGGIGLGMALGMARAGATIVVAGRCATPLIWSTRCNECERLGRAKRSSG